MKIEAAIAALASAAVFLAACSPSPASDQAAQSTPAQPSPAETPAPAPGAAGPAAGLTDASTTRDIHMALVIPGSNALFAAESAAPTDEAGWSALRTGADQVLQGAELLKTGSRPEGRADWIAAAEQVTTATQATRTALAQKNADDLVFTNGDMMTGCTACHQKFRQTQQ